MHSVPGPACGSWGLVIWLRSVPVRAARMGGVQQWVRVGARGNRAAHSPVSSELALQGRPGVPRRAACLMEVRALPGHGVFSLSRPRGPALQGGSPHPAGPCHLLPPEGGSLPPKQTLVKSLTKRFLSVFRNFGFGGRETRSSLVSYSGGTPALPRSGMREQPLGPGELLGSLLKNRGTWPGPLGPELGLPSKNTLEAAASWGPRIRRGVTPLPRPRSAHWLGRLSPQRHLAPGAGRWEPEWAHTGVALLH